MGRSSKYYSSLALLFILTIVLAYAATQLTINNSANVTIPNTNLFAVVSGVTGTTVCNGLPGYADTGLSITWPSVSQGSSANVNICLKNSGSNPDTLSFVAGTLPAGVSFSTSSQGAVLTSGGTLNVQLTLTAASTSPTGPFNFDLTIT